jgi:hypothetical protein
LPTAVARDQKGGIIVDVLPTQLLPTVPHIEFSIFDLAIPNIAAWAALIFAFAAAAWLRLPRFFEPRE